MIQNNGDEQDQCELINVGYGRALIMSINNAAQPDLSKSCIEQIEEEGRSEEVETQVINKWNEHNQFYRFENEANMVKAKILILYIDWRNPRRW
ncbi:MAG: hypothetical protein EZS28_016219 [Streblomastix strix]|uniref:Uncharacterized protein n=1 Tax=Streblomastix strix TaxID=222440 RepID=A0A5J4W078_9EUKA|nr:MAG: hypothetical protein EZS28_016219 [Streblomastix strix]